MSEFNYNELDQGIRVIVRSLREAGFKTTDSGDGVSKPADERVFECRHVVAAVNHDAMVSESHRMASLLGSGWQVEATYWPASGYAVLLATEL